MIKLVVEILLGFLKFLFSIGLGIVRLFTLFLSSSSITWSAVGQLFGVLFLIGVVNWIFSSKDDNEKVAPKANLPKLRPRIVYELEEEE